MPRIRCHYVNCVFLDDIYCGAAAVEIDPDEGCMTFVQTDSLSDDDWGDEDTMDDWEELDSDEDDLWLDDQDYQTLASQQ